MRALPDTSVLIGDEPPGDVEAAISVVSLAELHYGALVAADDDERAPDQPSGCGRGRVRPAAGHA
jgi:predicted nucleic acid-binding protein